MRSLPNQMPLLKMLFNFYKAIDPNPQRFSKERHVYQPCRSLQSLDTERLGLFVSTTLTPSNVKITDFQ
jgi:hypothetical protein